MKVFDLTVPLGPDTPLYPGDPAPSVTLLSDIAAGDGLTASSINLSCHVGTHIDLPAHFVGGGATLRDYPVSRFLGPAIVLDLSDVEDVIRSDRLTNLRLPKDRHVLVRTRNAVHLRRSAFYVHYVHWAPSAVETVLTSEPRSIGIDYYSLDPLDSVNFPSHRLCAERGVPVYVCLDLTGVQPGEYNFAGLPLRMDSLEGSPVRAVVWTDGRP